MKHSLLAFSLLLALGTIAEAKSVYRYTDDKGTTVLNSVLPPEVVPRGYTVLNEQGQVLEVVPPARTKEQLEADKIAGEKAKAVEKARLEARKRDAMLLASFTNMEDITRARDNQLAAIDVSISVAEGNIARLKGQLENLQARAADFERRGQAVPAAITADIAASLRQIEESEGFIGGKRGEQDILRKRFEGDIVRFQELHAARLLRNRSQGGVPAPGQEHGVYACAERRQCDKIWALAQLYAREKATTKLEIITGTIILTGDPKDDKDLSLSFSRVPEKGEKEQIVIEVRCAKTEAGQDYCASAEAVGVRDGFVKYADTRLKN